jgi:hypothetical protein
MEVVTPALAAIASLVDESTDNVDTEPADGALFSRRVQIRRAESERIERRPIVNETYPEAARPPPERDGDISTGPMRSMTMRYNVDEELFENDQKPRPLFIRKTAFVRERVGESLKPGELRMLGTQHDRRSHRRSSSMRSAGHPPQRQEGHVVRLLGATDKAVDVVDYRRNDSLGIDDRRLP